MFTDLGGLWRCAIPGQEKDVTLPGTLDENGVGHPETRAAKWHPDEHVNESLAESGVIATRFTRKVTYEGPAVFTRRFRARVPAGERVFLEAERARCLRLWVNGREVLPFGLWSLATPWVFEVTDLITGDDEFRVVFYNYLGELRGKFQRGAIQFLFTVFCFHCGILCLRGCCFLQV